MRMYLSLVVVVMLVAAAVPSRAEEREKKKPEAGSVGGIDAKDAGTITGCVRFKGTKPEAKPISDISGNAFCKECYKKKSLPTQQDLIFGRNGDDDTLQNV